MISAPLHTSHLLTESKPSIKTQGHLALLEWDETVPGPVSTALASFKHPTRRTVLDRCYEGGTVILFATTVAALAVSLCRF